jgi:palmitoyl-protein thioesterase
MFSLLKYVLLAVALPLNNRTAAEVTAVTTTYTSTLSTTYSTTPTTTFSTTLSTTFSTTPTTTFRTNALPIVVLHGIASTAENMETFAEWIEYVFQRKVYNVEIGNGRKTSLFMPLDEQLAILCDTIYAEEALAGGFDFIGMSQGGLLARGYVERCNKFPVRNLINLATPNGGVYIPTTVDIYESFYQEHLSISGYWRDPTDLEAYVEYCSYLPVINNERLTTHSTQFKANLLSLTNYVVIWSPNDDVLKPPASGKFSVFDINYNIIPLEETALYIQDLVGLRTLAERDQLGIYETNCSHVEHINPSCFDQLYAILQEYLHEA